jgi:hypothetical protein
MTLPSPRKITILRYVNRYGRLTRMQVQRLLGVSNDRVVRANLQELVKAHLLGKTRLHVVNPVSGAPAPVYHNTALGAEMLAAYFDDPTMLHAALNPPSIHTLFHAVAISDFFIVLDQAVAHQQEVSLVGTLAEWDEANPEATEPKDRYKLFTLIREKPKRLVCAPDGAFAISVGPYAKTYLIEIDRNTTGVAAASASKAPGFHALHSERLFRRFFPIETDTFTVLHVSPSAGRRDLMRKAFASKDSAALHRFTTVQEWQPSTALFAPIFFGCDSDEPQPLIRSTKVGAA